MNDMTIPKGFRFSGLASGLKKSGKLDLALIVSDTPAVCRGVFTRNRVVAAPVILTRRVVAAGLCQAILVNSGNANACTGSEGMAMAEKTAALTARALNIADSLVAVSSTGVIGVPLPEAPFAGGIPRLVSSLDSEQAEIVAEAMMTTDAFSKRVSVHEESGGYSLLGLAKGAGMIHPDMATMLGFVLTDARIEPSCLDRILRRAVADSFNAITVDGDTSTNDMVLVLANGHAGTAEITTGSEAAAVFEHHLRQVLLSLAKMIVRDGEGATKLVEIKVCGAGNETEARTVARSVATSALVKTAFFGQDANWGRIMAAVGYSGVEVDQERIDISFNDILLARNGIFVGPEAEIEATRVLTLDEFVVTIDLHQGEAQASYFTSDLSYDYVRINAAYRT